MILQTLLSGLFDFLYFILDFLPNVPSMPKSLSNSIDTFFSIIFDNLSLVSTFIRPMTLTLIVPIVIILLNFDKICTLVVWIYKKIPFLGGE